MTSGVAPQQMGMELVQGRGAVLVAGGRIAERF